MPGPSRSCRPPPSPEPTRLEARDFHATLFASSRLRGIRPAVIRTFRFAFMLRSAPLLAAAVLLLVACSSAKKDVYVERPVEELYNEAMDQVGSEDYTKAAKSFDEVERQHPYSVWAPKAQLMSCLLYTSPSPRDRQKTRMPSSA